MNRNGSHEQAPRAATIRRGTVALLLAINLFNYIDRYILAAVESHIRADFFAPGDPTAMAKTGSLATAFLITYMITSPIFGWLADRTSRWLLVAFGVGVWSLASAGSGLAATFTMLLATRCLVGVGEAAYGPAAPTIIADLYPVERRGAVLAWFFAAIPVGSALGYVFGGAISKYLGWRWPFFLVAPPGILLAVLCLLMRDPRASMTGAGTEKKHACLRDYLGLLKIPSYTLNVLAQAAMTFAIGALSFWAPTYIHEYRGEPDLARVNTIFGAIVVVAGLFSTLLGGAAGDKLTRRFPGAYFLVSGAGMMVAFPFTILMLIVPFPWAWACIFLAVFFLFFNIAPSNTALANVTLPSVRATAFALNVLAIHLLGDATSPPLIGFIAGKWNLNVGFFVVSLMMLAAGVIWLWSARYLGADTEKVTTAELAAARK